MVQSIIGLLRLLVVIGGNMSKVDLHLISWNRPAMTNLVIRTIHRNTKPGTFRLHVLDNGSEGETPYMLEKLRDAGLIDDLILLKTNMGLESARNLLFKEATQSDYFVCIDNDCLPQPITNSRDWLEQLVDLMDHNKGFGAISMRTNVMIGTGNIFEAADEHGEEIVEFPHPGGSFRIMRSRWVYLVGGWDRGAEGRGAEERYICGKLNEMGFRTAFATKVRCLHLFGLRTQTSERWGYAAGLKPEDTGHSDISHPALTNGDDVEEVAKYSGEELAHDYGSY